MSVERPTLSQVFWSHVRKGSGCWEWVGATDKDGYGKLKSGGRTLRAHRVSWQIHRGPIPAGMAVCHECDNPPCTRPDHLFLGSLLVNRRDAKRKGRLVIAGKANPKAKLTEAEVVEIRRRAANGENRERLAAEFGVNRSSIFRIIAGKQWAHISPKET